jgi:alpha-galactosidase
MHSSQSAATQSPRAIELRGATTSVILEWPDTGAPIWRYWGLHPGTRLPFAWRDAIATPPASLDELQPFTIAPTFGAGWFGPSALLAHRGGEAFAQCWHDCDVEQPDSCSVTITLRDTVAAVRLSVSIAIDAGTDVLSIQSTLTNEGGSNMAPLGVDWLAAGTLLLPASASAVHATGGVWANELLPESTQLSSSIWRRESRRGRAAHDNFPAAFVTCDAASDGCALLFGATLAWSGNHAQQISRLDDGRHQWQAGEWLSPGEVRLASGESLTSPVLFAACSGNGKDALAGQFHTALRARMSWPNGKMSPRPVHLNTWEAVYFDHDESALMALASDAATLGVERFVLDDGWFRGRKDDRAGLGDWVADPNKFPRGLTALAAHVRACGMQFGLWVEPEMVNPDSELYRSHPEWALHLVGRAPQTARNQLVLDLAKADVWHATHKALASLLSHLPIDYLKWDMNRDFTHAGNAAGRAAFRAHVQALYALLTRLRSEFAAVEIESCASGGGRMDYGILARTHRVWPSDSNDALTRLALQCTALQWLPPELLGSHVGAEPAHTTGRTQSLDFRAAVALPYHLGLELDPRRLSDDDRVTLTRWIELYRRIRPIVHGTQVWRGNCGDGVVWQAQGTPEHAIVFVYRTQPTTQRLPPSLYLPFLSAARDYTLRRIDPLASVAGFPYPDAPAVSGQWLHHAGVPLPRMKAESALVLEVKPA